MTDSLTERGALIIEQTQKLLNSVKAVMLPDDRYEEVKDLCEEAARLCREGKDDDAHRISELARSIVIEEEPDSSYE
jgi:hypothetical protein